MIEKLPVLAASAAVILLMLGVAFVLGFRRSASLNEAQVRTLASEEGAAVEHLAMADDSSAAIAPLTDGRLLVARVMGLDVSARFVAAGAYTLRHKGRKLSVLFGDPGYPSLHMKLESPPAWLAAMSHGEAR